jgi:signal transduction histidine kinase
VAVERPERTLNASTTAKSEPGPALPAGFWTAYEREGHELLVKRSRLLLLVASFLYLAFWFLDYMVARQFATSFLFIRLGVVAVTMLTFAATWLPLSTRALSALAVNFPTVAAVGISLMAAYQGGFTSDYYVGNLIVIFCVGLFMPLSLRAMVVFSSLVLGTYVAISASVSPFSTAAIPPIFFLGGAGVFACVAAVASSSQRRNDLALRLRIERANEDLKELDEAKMRFFANVSHELRTPLMLILGPLGALEEKVIEDKEALGFVNSIGSNANRLLRQVNTILDMSKLEAGRLRLDNEHGNVGEVLDQLVSAARAFAEHRGITLDGDGLGEIPDTIFDREKVEIIAANLISNALKFTSEGGRVTIRYVEATGPERIAFEVEDTGAGIGPEQVHKVFDRFHQVDSSLSREHEGTGLGLALARELAQLHEGNITLRSELGKGSVFRVELARTPPDKPIDRRQKYRRREDRVLATRKEAAAVKALRIRTGRGTLLADINAPRIDLEDAEAYDGPPGAPFVLVVEDNADLRALVAGRLARHYRVCTAKDGEEGLEKCRSLRPDLVVSDVMMPKMDGHELARRIKADESLVRTPIILATAKAGTEAIKQGLEVGADDYVTKPFDVRELIARIEAHLRVRRLRSELDERDSRLAAIGRMSSEIVHDLKNPLTAIMGFTDLAQMQARVGGDSEELIEDLDTVKGQADRLRRMLEEVLDFAKGGDARLNLEATPVRACLAALLDPMRVQLKENRVELLTKIALADSVKCQIDVDRLHRAVENLVVNAQQALQGNPPGKPGRAPGLAWRRLAMWQRLTAVRSRSSPLRSKGGRRSPSRCLGSRRVQR